MCELSVDIISLKKVFSFLIWQLRQQTHLEDMPVVDVAQLTDYEQMKGKLAIEVVSLEANSDMLSKIPHQEMEDMAVVSALYLVLMQRAEAAFL